MRVRRQGGATLGLTAACVLLVIVIGVGFYFLSKIIGGGREVANATDAGALNVAKQALKRGTVTLTATQLAEFGGLTDPPNSTSVNLITYNRIVAQAMMVAANAAAEDPGNSNTTAQHNAQATALMAQQIGQALKASLVTATTTASALPGDFNSISQSNNTKMWNGNAVSCTTISTGYLKPKGSTNIIFDPATIAAFNGWSPKDLTTGPSASNAPNNVDSLNNAVGNGSHYMPGYDFNTFPDSGISLTGVPVFPNTKPHLVDIGTFNADLAANNAFVADANTAANAFHANAQAVEAKSGNIGGTLACAVVGVLNKDYKASFPRGFVRINNGPDAVATNGSFGVPISDGTNDIFNNQLYTGPGAPPSANGIFQAGPVFTTNLSDLAAWGNFNNRVGMYDNSTQTTPQNNAQVCLNQGVTGPAWVAYNVNGSGYAYTPNKPVPQADLPQLADSNIQGPAPESIYDMALNPVNYDNTPVPGSGLRAGGTCNDFATLGQLEAIPMQGGANNGNFNCVYTMYDNSLGAPCGDQTTVLNWQNNYQCTTTFPTSAGLATSGNNQGVTNVEYLKAELLTKIAGRLGGHFCADVYIPQGQASGVKYYAQGVPGTPGTNAIAFDPRYASEGASAVVNFETVNTPLKYLQQISSASGLGSCASNSTTGIIEQMTQRMQQIESTVSAPQVQAALDTQPLHLKNATGVPTADNGTLYLYVDPTSKAVTLAPNLPSGWTDTTASNPGSFPDGQTPQQTGNGECSDYYPLNGWAVNTVFTKTNDGNGDPKGDAHYHDQPFTLPGNPGAGVGYGGVPGQSAGDPVVASDLTTGNPGPAIYGQDAAIFRQSSGAGNILGVLNFQENTQGTTFCKPN